MAITVSPAPVTSAIWSDPKMGMCTVFFPGSKTAMPRLPRVTTTAAILVRSSMRRPARSSTRRLSSMRTPSACSTSDSFGAHAVRPRYASARSASRPARARPRAADAIRDVAREGRRDQARAVVRDQHGIGVGDGGVRGARDGRAFGVGDRARRKAIDAHHLLLGRMDAAGEDAGLDGRAERRRAAPARGGRCATASRAPRGARARRGRPARPAAPAPPSAATLLAALPAPPGTTSVEWYSRISTGASRETRATRP